MAEPLQDLSGRSLMGVFAHPDDESLACGGLIARCSELGVRVTLLCLTRGEHGPGPDCGSLGDTRARELTQAAHELGVHDVVLLEHEDGMLPWIDAGTLEKDLLDAISKHAPDVVVTFDEDGLYWHPDHVAVHERATSVISELGTAAPALRYVSMPTGGMRAVADAAADDPGCGGRIVRPIFGVEDVDAFGSNAPAPDLIIEAGTCAGRKLAALRCHRSQVDGTALDCLDGPVVEGLLGTEHYRRAPVGALGDTFLERLGTPPAAGSGRVLRA